MRLKALLLFVSLGGAFFPILPVHCQMRTVGDGTQFLFSPGRAENYGIYSGDIGGNGDTIGTPLYTRHKRSAFDTGIGSSPLQTTSATSESRRSLSTYSSPALVTGGLSAPGSNFYSGSDGFNSPALSGFTVAPAGGLAGVGSLTGGYFNTGIGSDFANISSRFSGQSNGGSGLFQDLGAVPTFSRGANSSRSHSRSILPLSGPGPGAGAGFDSVLRKVEPQF